MYGEYCILDRRFDRRQNTLKSIKASSVQKKKKKLQEFGTNVYCAVVYRGSFSTRFRPLLDRWSRNKSSGRGNTKLSVLLIHNSSRAVNFKWHLRLHDFSKPSIFFEMHLDHEITHVARSSSKTASKPLVLECKLGSCTRVAKKLSGTRAANLSRIMQRLCTAWSSNTHRCAPGRFNGQVRSRPVLIT